MQKIFESNNNNKNILKGWKFYIIAVKLQGYIKLGVFSKNLIKFGYQKVDREK